LQAPIIYIPLAIEWAILITAFLPRLMAGMYYNNPRFGLTLWFTYLGSTILASFSALVITVWGLYEYFLTTWGRDSIEVELFGTLGLWILVAMTGIIISVINLKTEPLMIDAGIAKKGLIQTSRQIGEFEGYALRSLEFAQPLAFVARVDGKFSIFVSKSTFEALSEPELQAMYWHELGHIRGRHTLLNGIARTIALFTPMLKASHILVSETRALTERMADNFAKRRVSDEVLSSARAKFLE
jgi:Zn-dependent protease with chaperone function